MAGTLSNTIAAVTCVALATASKLFAEDGSADQAAIPTTAATNSSPYGYSQAQADAVVTLLNEMRRVLVLRGIMKGSA